MTNKNFPLEFPIEVKGAPNITEINLRRPKMRDVKKLESGTGTLSDRVLAMVGDLGELTPAQVDAIDPVDFHKVNLWLEPILDPKGQGSAGAGN